MLIAYHLHALFSSAQEPWPWYASCPSVSSFARMYSHSSAPQRDISGGRRRSDAMTQQALIALIIEVAGGFIVLFFGRRLFWVLIVSSLFGLGGVAGWIALSVGAIIGIAGAIFALVASRLLIRLTGLLVGIVTGLVAFILLHGFFGIASSVFFFFGWIVVGGLAGLALSRWAANLALVLFTALLGADAITVSLDRIVGLPSILAVPLFLVLLLLGLGVRAASFAAARTNQRRARLPSTSKRPSGFTRRPSFACATSLPPATTVCPASGTPLPRMGTAAARPQDEKQTIGLRRRRVSAARGWGWGPSSCREYLFCVIIAICNRCNMQQMLVNRTNRLASTFSLTRRFQRTTILRRRPLLPSCWMSCRW